MPKVSVIIPTHNRPDLVGRAINSVFAQTYRDFEVLVVDDGDQPAARKVIEPFLAYPNFRYLETTKNTGGAATRNLGVKEAKGEYVAFLDDDDEWLPEKLEKQIRAISEASPAVAYVFTAVKQKMPNGKELLTNVPVGEGDYHERSLTRFAGTLTSSLLVKKESLLAVGAFDNSMPSHQEAELIIRLSKDHRGFSINEPLVVVHEEGHPHIGGSLERRIKGRELVLAKHQDEFIARPKILAKHLFNIGLWHRDLGNMSEAKIKFLKAFKLDKKIRYLAHCVLSSLRLKPAFVLNLSLFGGSILLALLIGEIGLRFVLPLVAPPTFKVEEQGEVLRPDPILGHAIVPNSLYHDQNGFKNSNLRRTYQVVALGDSHTYGVYGGEADISWPNFLSQNIKQSVYNLGVWGYGPAEYRYLLDKALSFKPQTVLVGIYLGNDLFNSYDAVYHREYWADRRASNFIDDAPTTAATFKETTIPFKSVRDFFRQHSVLYSFLGDRTRLLREKIGWSKARNVGVKDWTNVDPEVSLIYNDRPELRTLFWAGSRVKGVDLSDKKILEGLRLTLGFLREMKLLSWQSGAELVVVLIPSKELAYAPILDQSKIKANVLMETIINDETKIRDQFLQFCVNEGLPCLDLTPELSAQLQAGQMLYQSNWDEHPNQAGYKAYADGIARYFRN